MVLPSRMAVLNHMSDDTEVDVKQVMTALKKTMEVKNSLTKKCIWIIY